MLPHILSSRHSSDVPDQPHEAHVAGRGGVGDFSVGLMARLQGSGFRGALFETPKECQDILLRRFVFLLQ
jgi:hypothetical protein